MLVTRGRRQGATRGTGMSKKGVLLRLVSSESWERAGKRLESSLCWQPWSFGDPSHMLPWECGGHTATWPQFQTWLLTLSVSDSDT